MLRHLLLATDFSPVARKTYAAATFLAREYGASLELVHVAEPLPPFYYTHVADIFPSESYHSQLAVKLDEEAQDPAFEGIEVKTRLIVNDDPIDAFTELARQHDADLVMLSTHGRSGLGHVLLGSFAERVVRHSPAPVLTCRDPKEGGLPPRSALVPFDFSANSRAVLPKVRCLASRFGTTFTFLDVLDTEHASLAHLPRETFYEDIESAAQEARRTARERFERVRERDLPGVDAEFEVRDGSPADAIVRRASELESDLVLMATHGWTGLPHALLGSVAERVVRHAPCSVLTVRPREIQKGGFAVLAPPTARTPAHNRPRST